MTASRPSSSHIASLTKAEVDSLVSGRHGDPFSVLGFHRNNNASSALIRVFRPGANAITVLDSAGDPAAELSQIHDQGLFEASVPVALSAGYRLSIAYPDATLVVDDPYRFPSSLSETDLYLFSEGSQERLYRWMGATPCTNSRIQGINFVVWAPNASRVSIVGDFNHWDSRQHPMRFHPAAGIWELFVPGLTGGVPYKFQIHSQHGHALPLKADPCAQQMQLRPETASITPTETNYHWGDQQWMQHRPDIAQYQGPVSIYEIHAGSWQRTDSGGFLNYRELAGRLIPYVLEMGFTHIQLMPISEHPFDGSWGYQPVGLFAPTSRFGSPDDLRHFVDQCHQHGIGVLLDWVPGHFPTDEHGLGRFDGTCLYEHEDPRKGFHPDWNTLIYNYGRAEVVSILLSNALYWLDEFHIDGLRVDAVASMLYLDYSREADQWIPNEYGGRENLEAIELLKQVNSRLYFNFPGAMTVAEESTAWPGVSKPVDQGGLGFGFKWNMGWMNDTLSYMSRDPIHRKYHHNEMTFGLVYGFSENYILPISHDEVVHGKGSLINKMPGDGWQKFANLRAYFGFMWSHPGKKLLFMGCEFAQEQEWQHDHALDWWLCERTQNVGVKNLVRDLNHLYRTLPALHQLDCNPEGFDWIDYDNAEQSIFTFTRYSEDKSDMVLVVVNMTPTPYTDYEIPTPRAGHYQEVLNTDSEQYGGSNWGNFGGVSAYGDDNHGYHIRIAMPPLATTLFRWCAP